MSGVGRERACVALALGLALGLGAYRACRWPWSGYDEAGHLEHVLFLAEHHRSPALAEMDLALRQRVSDVFLGLDCRSDRPEKIRGCLGYHQLGEQPAYYVFQAAMLMVARPPTVIGQLHRARLANLLLFAATVAAAYTATRRAYPRWPPLALGVAGFIALLPSFARMAITVNNDVMAALAGTVLIWSVLEVVGQGVTPRRLAAVVFAMLLAASSKTTAMVLLPAAVVGIWLSLPVSRAWRIASLLLVGAAATFALVDTRGSAAWTKPAYRHLDRQRAPAPIGKHVFALQPGQSVEQRLSPAMRHRLERRVVTVGAWIRAPQGPAVVSPPLVAVGDWSPSPLPVRAGPEWRFTAWSTRLPAGGRYLRVALPAPMTPLQYDGVLLAAGDFSGGGTPSWTGPDAAEGWWNGRPVHNLLRNGSAERGWLLLRDAVDRRLPVPGGMNRRIASWYGWRVDPDYYRGALLWVLTTFWRTGDVARPLRAPEIMAYATVTGVALIGLLAAGIAWARSPGLATPEVRLVGMHGLFAVSAVVATVLRLDPPTLSGFGLRADARYVFPALLSLGTLLFLGIGRGLPSRVRSPALGAFLIGLVAVDLWLGGRG